MDDRYLYVFKGNYIPPWIKISAAFSYFLGIVEALHDVPEDQRRGHVDFTSRCGESVFLPTADECEKICGEAGDRDCYRAVCFADCSDEVCKQQMIIYEVERSLFRRLRDGAIRCRGRLEETARVCSNPHDPPHEYFMGDKDETKIVGDRYKIIPCSYFDEYIGYIDYLDNRCSDWEISPESVIKENCDLVTSKIELRGINVGESFVWKEEWVCLQVNTDDLLQSTQKIFRKYFEKTGDLREGDYLPLFSEEMKITGRNRFYYSRNLDRWVVEFRNKVFTIDYRSYHLTPIVIQRMLKYGNVDHNEEIKNKKCSYQSLNSINSMDVSDLGRFLNRHLQGRFEEIGDNRDGDNIELSSLINKDVQDDGSAYHYIERKTQECKDRYDAAIDSAEKACWKRDLDLFEYIRKNCFDRFGNLKDPMADSERCRSKYNIKSCID